MRKTQRVRAVSFSALIQDRLLPWPTPMRELLKAPEAGDFVWRRLHYVFSLEDPRAFPMVALALTDDEEAVLRRFVAQAGRLAGTALLGADDSVTISIPDDGVADEGIDSDLSDPDVTAGHMLFVRQCFADEEEASFSKARKILERRLHEAGEEQAIQVLASWRKAHARLRNQALEELVQERMVSDGLMPADTVGPDGRTHSAIVRAPASPRELLQTLWYGDQMHWGKHRHALSAIQTDPFAEAMWEMAARQASSDLSHFYLGFALLLEAALDRNMAERAEADDDSS